MNNISEHIKNTSTLKYSVYLFLLGYFPILILGYFIQDDHGIIDFYNYSIKDSTFWMCGVNSNRPLSCLYFALLTRIWPNFQIYFLFIFFVYFVFIYFVLKIFNFLIYDRQIKKLFITFLIFPFFSYTIFYSPAMQGIGVFSLLFWSLSLLFLKKFIDEKKISYLIINYLFIFSMFLTYESATPLLGISLFFPLLFKKYKIFIVNLIITLFIMSFIYYLQKYVFSEIFNIDLSRIKLSISDYKKILFLILVNSALTINILFQSLEIFLKSIIYNIATFNIMLFLHISLLVYFIFVVFKKIDFEDFKQKNFKSNYYKLILILMVLSVIFLNILMHVLADTGIEFIRYNNRALTSLSFITAFISLISFNIFNKVNKKKLIFINLIIFFIFVNNFLFFQHNLIKERYDAKYIVKKEYPKSKSILDTSKKNLIFIVIKQNKLRNLLSYGSYDALKIYTDQSYEFWMNKPIYIKMSENKFCNKSYYNEYIDTAFLKQKNISINVYTKNQFIQDISQINLLKLFSNSYNCRIISKEISKDLKREVYLDDRFQSTFLIILKRIYSWLK